MRRRLSSSGVLLAVALLASGCANQLGPGTPECVDQITNVPGAVIIQLQAVRDARWGICIEELKVGWEYERQEAKLGEATFWLSSDRMGDRFAAITLAPSCDPAGAIRSVAPQPEMERFVKIDEQPGPIQIAVIPVAPRHASYAAGVLAQLAGMTIEGRPVTSFVPVSNASPAIQIERALANGQVVLVVDDREEATNSVEMRRSGGDPMVGVTVEEAMEVVEDELGHPRYTAQWYHVFSGGCITYDIDASGAGAETIAEDLDDVLGFYPLAELLEGARAAGFEF